MNLKCWIVALSLAVCAAAFADDAQEQVPPEPGSDEVKAETPTTETPTPQELSDKLESFGEAFTEMRNSLENLSHEKSTRTLVPASARPAGLYQIAPRSSAPAT